MHLGLPHTEPLNWNLGWERQKPFSALQHIIPSVTALGQRMVVPPTFAGLESLSQLNIPFPASSLLPDNILERYLQEDRFGYRPPTPFLGGGLDMLPVNPVNNIDPGTMYNLEQPVNQLPNQATGISPRLSDREPILEGNNPAAGSGFPTRYIYPDKTTGTVPRPTRFPDNINYIPSGIRPRRSDREPILEGNNPIVNTGLPTGNIGPLPARTDQERFRFHNLPPSPVRPFEGNNPPVPAPGPEGIGGFAHFMRTRGTPLSNDQLINAQIALGLGLGLR